MNSQSRRNCMHKSSKNLNPLGTSSTNKSNKRLSWSKRKNKSKPNCLCFKSRIRLLKRILLSWSWMTKEEKNSSIRGWKKNSETSRPTWKKISNRPTPKSTKRPRKIPKSYNQILKNKALTLKACTRCLKRYFKSVQTCKNLNFRLKA